MKKTDKELLKLAHEHLASNDVEWVALDLFRVWYKRPYESPDGVLGIELGYNEFQIKPLLTK